MLIGNIMVKKIDFMKAVIIGKFFQLTWVPFSITSGVQILLIFRVTLSLENVISTRNRIFRIIITEETVVMAC